MPHAFHNGTGNCETCRFLAKLAMNPKGADASSSNSSEDLSRSRDVPQPAERESSQLPEAMEAEMAVVPWGPMVGGYPEPATSIPTLEELLQSTGTMGESYPEGVKMRTSHLRTLSCGPQTGTSHLRTLRCGFAGRTRSLQEARQQLPKWSSTGCELLG